MTDPTTGLRRAATAFLLLAAGSGFALGSAPAAGAATCTSSGGVSVVVDYRELGGTTVTACAPDGGGRNATAIFASVGVQLSYATRQPGFVCRVNGAPASDPCVNTSPANAYWGLWWADGSTASWTYSSYAVGGLTVPAGGSVGWSWQQDRPAGGSVPPAVAPPVVRSSTPSATPSPPSTPTSSPSSSPSSSPTSSPSPTPGSPGSGSSSPTGTPSGGGNGSSSGASGGTSGNGGAGSSGGSSPQATPSGSPLTTESSGDSRSTDGSRTKPADGTRDDESPADSEPSEGAGTVDSDVESPGDSTATTGQPRADQPDRIPAAVTWSIVGLLAIAIAGSAVVARRRRRV